MIACLPIWWCLTEDVKKGLTPLLSNDWVVPPFVFQYWVGRGYSPILESLEEIDRLMRHRPRGRVKVK